MGLYADWGGNASTVDDGTARGRAASLAARPRDPASGQANDDDVAANAGPYRTPRFRYSAFVQAVAVSRLFSRFLGLENAAKKLAASRNRDGDD